MRRRTARWAAVPIALALVAAACGDDDDGGAGGDDTTAETGEGDGTAAETEETEAEDEGEEGEITTPEPEVDVALDIEPNPDLAGTSVTVTGPEVTETEAGAIIDTLTAFAELNDMEISYAGSDSWEAEIGAQVAGGNPPDIGIFPQPGLLADFARTDDLIALDDDLTAVVEENWPESWTEFGVVDDVQYGVPIKADLKSLVWYQPARFEEIGYEVPETFDDFTALVDQMTTDGETPLCVGIESGEATGWPFTDWVEDMVLRQHGADVYDQWAAHEIPFNDERIVESMETVLDLWTEDNVYASGGAIETTDFRENGPALTDGQCLMHRQASFFSAFFPEGTPAADGSDEAVDVFYFPDINDDAPVLVAGTIAAAFNDDPAVLEVLEFMSTPEYATGRQEAQAERAGGLSGFLSLANGQDMDAYQPLEQSFIEILETSEIARFDASDAMPGEVGSAAFWTQATSAVTGAISAQEAADAIEEAWPS